MKSYCSRFLHPTPSHSNGKPQSTPILSYSGLTRISRWNKFANWFDPDTPIKSECDSLCAGRSMVEMLGVLAIIGVLSVGAIAGYSKAMMKYKLNKHAEGFNMLLNDILRYSSELKQNEDWTYYGDFFNKLGLIPDGLHYRDNLTISDNFKNIFRIYAAPLTSEYKGGIMIQINGMQKEVCYNFVQTAKENSENLWLLESMETNDVYQGHIFGDKYCTKNNKCLKDLKISDFEALCDTDKLGWLYIMWK